MAVKVENISKSYGTNLILEKIDFEIHKNSIYCLVGRNGVGKTTLLNIISNLSQPDSGSVLINGLNYQKNEKSIKKILGLQLNNDQLIPELSLGEYLFFIGKIYQVQTADIYERIDLLTAYFFDPGEITGTKIENFSAGMKKKAMLCAALIHKPSVLILDEPFANLDPVTSELLCQYLIRYKSGERIILISSHDLLYVNKIGTHLGVLNNKSIIYNDSIESFKQTDQFIDKRLLELINNTASKEDLIEKLI
jgi:ABC-2 type transport system ATP-binding protein